MKKLISIILLFSSIFIAAGCQSKSGDSIPQPNGLNSQTQKELSSEQEAALLGFISELTESYNQGNCDSYTTVFVRTAKFDDTFSTLKQHIQGNDKMQDAANRGFVIIMSATLGTITPGESATIKELREYLKNSINDLIKVYCH